MNPTLKPADIFRHHGKSAARLLTTLILLTVALASVSTFAVEQTPPHPTFEKNTNLDLIQPDAVKNPKIDSSIAAATGGNAPYPVVFELTEAKDAYVEALKREGVIVQSVHEDLVQGLVTPERIVNLQRLEFVRFIRSPLQPILQAVVSEGVRVIQADLAAQNRLTGRGVKVAVIDAGFDVENSVIAANVKEFKVFKTGRNTFSGDSAHGTAVAEIIVNTAPDVELYLYSINSDMDFLDALEYAVGRGVKIISMSLAFYNAGPYDGSSIVSRAVDSVRKRGVLPLVASGNEARTHWEGVFTDPDGDRWHEWKPNSELNNITLNAGQKISMWLSWNDWNRSCQDYDLYLLDSDRRPVTSSTNPQSCMQPPTEKIQFTAERRGVYYIAIRNSSATRPVTFDLYVDGVGRIQHYVESGSIPNLSDANGALTVGATYWANDVLEYFSGRGPTADGRIKPDVVAPDGVSSAVYSEGRFYGTSAATPHVAGAAAILFSAKPSLTAEDVVKILEGGAKDLGASGKDNLYGAGRIRLSFTSINTDPRGSSLIVDGSTYTPQQLPALLIWMPGTTHTLRVVNPTVEAADTRHIFTGWFGNNDELSNSQTATVAYTGGPMLVVAEFKTQFLLTVASPYGSPKGGGWYDSGNTAIFSVSSPSDHENRTRRVFLAWSGDSSANTVSADVTMDSPKRVAAAWGTQYYLEVGSSYGEVKGEGWYDRGGTAQISVSQLVDQGNLTRRVFAGWGGDASQSSVYIDSPKRVVAGWITQYYLTVKLNGGEALGEGWYDKGALANVTVRPLSGVVEGRSRLAFTGWGGDVVSESPTVSLRMSQPRLVSAGWKRQFFVNVVSSYGSVSGGGWYDDGSIAALTVASPVDQGNRTRRVFLTWSGDYVSPASPASVVVDSAKRVVAEWTKQYHLEVKSPYGAPAGVGWYDSGVEATFSAPPLLDQGNETRRVFNGWVGDVKAAGYQSSVKMDSPKIVAAEWITQYLLNIDSGGGVVDAESMWVDRGSSVTVTAVSPSREVVNRSRLVFAGWSGAVASLDPQVTVTVNEPKRLGAGWKTQFYLRLVSQYGESQGEEWYDEGSTATASVSSPVGILVQQVFTQWSGDAESRLPSFEVFMDSPKTLVAEWVPDYTQMLVLVGGVAAIPVAFLALRMRRR